MKIFKKWWFWLIVVLIIAFIGSGVESDADEPLDSTDATVAETTDATDAVSYEVVDLQQMMNELGANALKAEKTYQDMYVQITCKIANFDSDGKYISVEPVDADEWNFNTAMCYIKNEDQLNFLLEKAVGDTITIKGRVKSIGEVIGYSFDMDEIN
jgi:hypothetical protein